MIDLTEVTSTWPKDADGWSVSPGTDWCSAGYRMRVGRECVAGDYFKAGNYFKAGDFFAAGNYFKAGNYFTAGNYFKAGDFFAAGNYFKVGDGFKAGDNARGLACIGHADGYWKSLSAVDGVAYIGAGCRWFTLADAIRHWSNHTQDRRATLALMQAAKALAEIHGLKEE